MERREESKNLMELPKIKLKIGRPHINPLSLLKDLTQFRRYNFNKKFIEGGAKFSVNYLFFY